MSQLPDVDLALQCKLPICSLGSNVNAVVPGAPSTAIRGGVWNRHLPYSADLPAEAADNIALIKQGLADAIAVRTLQPGIRYWCGRLTDHLVLYQYLLSPEDHANCAVLLFRIFELDGIDETLQERTAAILRRLLKKKDLMASTAIIVQWRPLYDLMIKYFFCKLRRTSEVHRGLGEAIVKLIKESRRFFTPESTTEIMNELSPLLCPHDEVCFRAAGFLSLLLPTNADAPAATSPAFVGWFEQLFAVWAWVRNTPDWDFAFVQLFSRLAKDNFGKQPLGWQPHLPWLFNKILSMLNIPVGSSGSSTPHQYGLPWNVMLVLPGGRGRIAKVAILLVYMMAPGNEVMDYLERLLESIRAFYHPSNTGRWSNSLAAFMLSLCEFSKSPTMVASAAWALRHLSYLAPDIVLPNMMKRIYPALETVTETHQAFAALSTLAAVARPLLWAENFAGGAKHLIPLLQCTLPGIDPNDSNKTQVTLQFLMVVFMNVYLVDCSRGPIPEGVDPEQREILLSTALFEDWAMQFFDRIFSVLGTLVPASKKKNQHTTEGSLCEWIELICHRFFQQVSPPIFKLALDRVFRWVTSSMYLHLGKTAGKICAAAAEVDPTTTLRTFLPTIANIVSDLIENHATVDEVDEDTDAPLDDELEWYLNILARIVIRTGDALVEYRDTLVHILDRGLRLKAAKAAKLCGKLLRHMLKALTGTYVRETCTLTAKERSSWKTDPVGLFRHWGNSPDVLSPDDLAVEWHVASEAELEFATELVDLFYRPATRCLKRFVTGELEYRHDILVNALMVVRNFARVGPAMFPDHNDPSDDLYAAPAGGGTDGADSFMARIKVQTDVLSPDFVEQFLGNRAELMALTHALVDKLLTTSEDDTKLFKLTIKIAFQLLCVRGIADRKHVRQTKMWSWLKQGSADLVRPGKRYSRAMLLQRVDMQHQRRKNKSRVCIPYTAAFQQLLGDLVRLGTSRYAVVRKRAQNVVSHITSTHPIARHDVFKAAVGFLDMKPEEMESKHQQIKGAMFLLCSKSISRLVMQHPRYAAQLAKNSLVLEGNDRPSVQTQVNQLFGYLSQENRATSLGIVITKKAFEAAQALFPTIADKLDFFVGESVTLSDKRGVATRQELLDCQLELARLLENATQGWKFEVLVAGLLGTKIRERADVPDVVLAYYGNALISDSLKLRHLAVRATSFILAVTKQRPLKELYGFNDGGGVVHLTIPITAADQSKAVDSLPRPWRPRSQIDKYPHCYSTADSAKFEREEVFNSTVFVDKNFVGWSLFPQQIRTYPSLKEQPILAPTASMSLMWDVVSRAGFFDVHCDLFSQDKADGTAARFSEAQAELYKGLARNHGVKFLELVRPRIEHLLAKTDTDGVSETTAKFRCAGELIAGIVRGSKHWRHDELQTMWAFIIPTLESTLPRVEHHTIGNFSSMLRYCVYDRDPRRFYPLCELFFRPFSLAVDQGDTSFEQFRHLELFVGISEELSWRGVEAAHDLLTRIRPFAAHPYKIVREKIARSLAVIFRSRLAPGLHGPDPQFAPFIAEVVGTILEARDFPDGDERKKSALLLAKTMMKWTTIVFYEGFDATLVWHLPTVLPMIMAAPELSKEDDELTAMSRQALGFVSQTKMICQEQVDGVLASVVIAARDESWHVRERALRFLQVFFFRNLFFVPTEILTGCIVKCLEDPQLEVRDVASTTLSGMVRCGLVGDDLLNRFVALSNTKIRKAKRQRTSTPTTAVTVVLTEEEKRAVVQRHAGILGVHAFVAGFPYDIPAWLPEVLLALAKKISDPEPLKSSVKKTLGEFWRTHQDDRKALTDAFDEDQFATLRDLVVGYNYYA